MGKFLKGVVFFLNWIAALILLTSFILPYLPPSKFPIISLLSLAVPLVIVVNLVFLIYWVIRFNRRFFLSFSVLLFSFFHFNVFFENSTEGDAKDYDNTLSVMSFNVRLFNAFEKESHGDVPQMMAKLIEDQAPDVICIQEYYRTHQVDFSDYPHQFIHFRRKDSKVGYAVFSKYPLINKGAFDFKNSNNNTIYADVIKDQDTIRIYNVHLQSMGVLPEVQFLQSTDKERLFRRLSSRFRLQEQQINAILEHKATTTHPVIFSGDMNNTPFSYSYRKIKTDMKDAFRKGGSGLGTTFYFDRFPLRIDYIFTSTNFDIISFETIKETFSDHHAIQVTLGW